MFSTEFLNGIRTPPKESISDADFSTFTQVLTRVFSGQPAHVVEKLLEERGLWVTAFTDKSFDAKYNYEALEFIGDPFLSAFLKQFLVQRFPQYSDQRRIKMLARQASFNLSKVRLADISRRFQFDKLIRCSDGVIKINTLEDVFEAFVGALFVLTMRQFGQLAKYDVFFDIMTDIFTSETFALDPDQIVDSKTKLKELLDVERGLGHIEYIHDTTPQGETTMNRSEVFLVSRDGTRESLGFASHKSRLEADKLASAKALVILAQRGYARRFQPEKNVRPRDHRN